MSRHFYITEYGMVGIFIITYRPFPEITIVLLHCTLLYINLRSCLIRGFAHRAMGECIDWRMDRRVVALIMRMCCMAVYEYMIQGLTNSCMRWRLGWYDAVLRLIVGAVGTHKQESMCCCEMQWPLAVGECMQPTVMPFNTACPTIHIHVITRSPLLRSHLSLATGIPLVNLIETGNYVFVVT